MSFVQNTAAFLKVTGVQHAHWAIALAQVPWESDDQRDQFIADLTSEPGAGP